MVWGGISASCVGYLLKMNGIMKGKMIVRLSSKSSKCILGIFFLNIKWDIISHGVPKVRTSLLLKQCGNHLNREQNKRQLTSEEEL